MKSRKPILALAAALTLSVPAAAVSAAEQTAVAGPGGFELGYLTPTITISKGDSLVFTNLDAFEHNIVHDVTIDGFGGSRKVSWCTGASGEHHDHDAACPVFWSELIGLGEETEVLGLNRVKPGKTYSFFCTKHHDMKGTLTVNP